MNPYFRLEIKMPFKTSGEHRWQEVKTAPSKKYLENTVLPKIIKQYLKSHNVKTYPYKWRYIQITEKILRY